VTTGHHHLCEKRKAAFQFEYYSKQPRRRQKERKQQESTAVLCITLEKLMQKPIILPRNGRRQKYWQKGGKIAGVEEN